MLFDNQSQRKTAPTISTECFKARLEVLLALAKRRENVGG
jgi:hypothetical protein